MDIEVKISRMEELRRLIVGLPDNQIDLRVVQVDRNDKFVESERSDEVGLCNSIVCICGAAWLHPPFVADGIRSVPFSGIDSRIGAAVRYFGVSEELFDNRWASERGAGATDRTDKQVALNRIDAKLEELYEARIRMTNPSEINWP